MYTSKCKDYRQKQEDIHLVGAVTLMKFASPLYIALSQVRHQIEFYVNENKAVSEPVTHFLIFCGDQLHSSDRNSPFQ